MLYYLSELSSCFGPLRLFNYVTFRAGGAWLASFLIVLLLGKTTVRLLRKFNMLAAERLEGLVPAEFIDKRKSETPCMGGLLIIGAIIVSTLIWAKPGFISLALTGATLLFTILGFTDDYIKVAKQGRDGLSATTKFILQTVIASGVMLAWSCDPYLDVLLRDLFIPFAKEPVVNSLWCYPFAVLVIVGTCNAVNLTDGKDGLASGCTIFCVLTYAAFAYLMGHRIFAGYLGIPYIYGIEEAVVFAAAICGACIGFLWHNCHPASMFMGDTGSLPLGGAIGMLAVLVRQEVLLIVVGGVFVIEAGSVILQKTSRFLTGRKLFICTPIHHHFERKGWTETQIVVRFWILAGVFALIALATLKLR